MPNIYQRPTSEWQKNKSFKLSGLFLFLSMTNNCQVFFLMCHESEVIDNFGAVLNDSTKQVLNEFAKYKSSKIKKWDLSEQGLHLFSVLIIIKKFLERMTLCALQKQFWFDRYCKQNIYQWIERSRCPS